VGRFGPVREGGGNRGTDAGRRATANDDAAIRGCNLRPPSWAGSTGTTGEVGREAGWKTGATRLLHITVRELGRADDQANRQKGGSRSAEGGGGAREAEHCCVMGSVKVQDIWYASE
jgi:hypothetical protein